MFHFKLTSLFTLIMENIRELIFYSHYFEEFFGKQTEKVKEKIDYVLFILTHIDVIPEKFLKHITNTKGLYEIRVESGSNIFKFFGCFDKGKIMVLLNAFQKKTQKTPVNEIDFAIKLMNQYFLNK